MATWLILLEDDRSSTIDLTGTGTGRDLFLDREDL
ncbi:uncharacterized protein DNG_04839 [Cephalotrichum gorgonifer]|uniref:Uncharacterized protein n=1 Tax=Cephalotrichum gorgonifer TaxID=2041049 RepID=A0AAE8MWT5_9PEZI|nr:uncharacterized protein DNG_04839 [Cephalotrichum gorgonifer]